MARVWKTELPLTSQFDIGGDGYYIVEPLRERWTCEKRRQKRAEVLRELHMHPAPAEERVTISNVARCRVSCVKGTGWPGYYAQEVRSIPSISWFDRAELLRWKGPDGRRALVLAVMPASLSLEMIHQLRRELEPYKLQAGVYPRSSWDHPGAPLVLVAPLGVLEPESRNMAYNRAMPIV